MSNILMSELADYTGQLLEVGRFRDYCPNGLQVQGRERVGSLVTGVTASLALLEAAHQAGADAILVHHGYFWRNEPPQVTGIKHRRLGLLLRESIGLLAYHLPLDAHPELGNNTQLAARFGIVPEGRFGEQEIGLHGRLDDPVNLQAFGSRVAGALGRPPLVIGDPDRPVRRIALCSGAAQGMFEEAAALGIDLFITGEASEQSTHLARELGVAFIAAGHHATERYGVQALGEHLAQRFGIRHLFIDIDNPV